jgi:hypothetical protein
VNVWPAIVSVPVREAPTFSATVKTTEPLPVPVTPDVMVSHGTLLLAVHAQPLPAETLTVPLPALASTFWPDAESENVQEAPAPAACVTVDETPAIMSAPVRAAPVFAATVNAIDAFPVPLDAEVIVIHGTLLLADHEHVVCVDRATDIPAPPDAGTFCVVGDTE